MEMSFVGYVTVDKDIEAAYQRINEATARLAVIDDEIATRVAEYDSELKNKANKPKGMASSLYKSRLQIEKRKYLEEMQREKDRLPKTIKRGYIEIKEYEQRVVDVEKSLSNLLKSLYLKLNASDDF